MQPHSRPLAIVTGASSGIGLELAMVFAQEGYDLIIVSGSNSIFAAAEKISVHGGSVEPYSYDLTDTDALEDFFDRMIMLNRPIAAVAINAGVGVGGHFSETSLDEEINLINLNITSSVHLSKRVVQHMLSVGQGGRMLFTASIASTMPGPYEAVYAASKAFIYSFSEALHHELKDKGITVTAMLPGPTDTNFFRRAHMSDTKAGAGEKDAPADVARQGFDALMAGKDQVIVGSFKTKAMSMANDLIPEQVKAGLHADLTKPGGGGEG